MRWKYLFLGFASVATLVTAARADDAPLPPLPVSPDQATAPPPTVSPAARAVPPGYVPDAVFLKSGGLVRGAVVESVPDDHVTIAMPTGDVRRIPWTEVDHVTIGPTAPVAAPPPPETPKRGPLVRVHISTDQNVLLDRRPEGSETWVPACAAPCDEELPLGDTYRLSGSSLRSSAEFQLHGSPGGRVELGVDASTKRAWWVGAGIGGMGLVIDGYGLYIALLGSLMASSSCNASDYSVRSCDGSRSSGQTMRNVGLVMLIPGTAAAIIGGAMMVGNWRTGIVQSEGTEHAAAKARPLDAFTRTAEVRPPEPIIGGAPTLWVPLAAGKF